MELYRRSGKSLVVIAEELGIATEPLRSWNKQHAIDVGEQQAMALHSRDHRVGWATPLAAT